MDVGFAAPGATGLAACAVGGEAGADAGVDASLEADVVVGVGTDVFAGAGVGELEDAAPEVHAVPETSAPAPDNPSPQAMSLRMNSRLLTAVIGLLSPHRLLLDGARELPDLSSGL